ncbi:MAG TPA: hypothetical protein VG944_03105 [Fimbriimonas sp.]|nr:hypothetical protein [Fimbriimonas sp.]
MSITEDAQALLATLSKATPGEWEIAQAYRTGWPHVYAGEACVVRVLDVKKTDADAIVAAHNDAPKIINALIERIAELEAQVSK